MKKKKKFRDTAVGRILGGTLKLINPTLGGLVQGTNTVEELLQSIKESDVPPAAKAEAQSLVLEAFEAEVNDRISARNREAAVAAAGGSDILFKTIGWSISASFLMVVLFGLGVIPQHPDLNKDFLMFSSGAVTSAFMAVVSYYFGSSLGSKQKQHLINKDE